ncbi:MAG TPA: hypothetical protein PLM62_12005, partial [Zoogloea sp.]|nr:hypothetical protein [Zoogloea sp.]
MNTFCSLLSGALLVRTRLGERALLQEMRDVDKEAKVGRTPGGEAVIFSAFTTGTARPQPFGSRPIRKNSSFGRMPVRL